MRISDLRSDVCSSHLRSSSCALPSLLTNSLLPDRTPSPSPPPPPRCKSFVPTFVLRSYPRRSFRMDTAARAFLLFSRTYNHSFIRRFCQMRHRPIVQNSNTVGAISIGRASCRETVCQYVSLSVDDVSFKNNN